MKLDADKTYGLWWDGNERSTRILHTLREQEHDFLILQFRQFWSKDKAKRVDEIIKDLNLKVFSYPLASLNFIGNVQAVFEIAVKGGMMPIVADLTDGDKCLMTLTEKTLPFAPITADVYIVAHGKSGVRNGVTYWNPLEDEEREVETVSVCHECIKGTGQVFCPKVGQMIPSVEWNPEQNLAAFEAVYG